MPKTSTATVELPASAAKALRDLGENLALARQRRKGFLSGWQSAYALIPTGDGALKRACPGAWELYRRDPDGFRFVSQFDHKPDAEEQALALAGGAGLGLGGNLKVMDAFIEGLRN